MPGYEIFDDAEKKEVLDVMETGDIDAIRF